MILEPQEDSKISTLWNILVHLNIRKRRKYHNSSTKEIALTESLLQALKYSTMHKLQPKPVRVDQKGYTHRLDPFNTDTRGKTNKFVDCVAHRMKMRSKKHWEWLAKHILQKRIQDFPNHKREKESNNFLGPLILVPIEQITFSYLLTQHFCLKYPHQKTR